jgi:hypothetical protein
MYLKDLISALQELYESYTEDYKDLAGEPEITIDRFEKINAKSQVDKTFEFKGVTPNISVRRSYDGVFLVLTSLPEIKKARKRLPKKTKKRDL